MNKLSPLHLMNVEFCALRERKRHMMTNGLNSLMVPVCNFLLNLLS